MSLTQTNNAGAAASEASRLVDLTCADFADGLAAARPVPGGGGAAAYAGALGVALASMAGAFTVGKARYADVQGEVEVLLAECEGIRARMVELVDGDAAAYGAVARAYKLPKDDPSRHMRIQAAMSGAADVPLAIMEGACRTIEVLERMAEVCSRMLIADVGCGANLSRAALGAAQLSVTANTCALDDHELARDLDARASQMWETFAPRADALSARVADIMRRGE